MLSDLATLNQSLGSLQFRVRKERVQQRSLEQSSWGQVDESRSYIPEDKQRKGFGGGVTSSV